MVRWRVAYERAGIAAEPAPESLRRFASRATHIITSDLPRAVRSAEVLGYSERIITSERLREAPLAIPRWPTRLPVHAWDAMVHVCWGYRILRGTDVPDAEGARAVATADWLTGLVSDESTALVVTHGVLRRILLQHLLARGWSCAERRSGYAPWSSWRLLR